MRIRRAPFPGVTWCPRYRGYSAYHERIAHRIIAVSALVVVALFAAAVVLAALGL